MYQNIQRREPDTSEWQGRFAQKFEQKQQHLIALLQYVQQQEGYLPPDAILAVADFLDISRAQVFGVASFYKQFRLTPMGKNMIRVCLGTACHVQGGGRVHEVTREQLSIAEEQDTTENRLWTVEPVACLGCCSLAPVVMVNETTHGNLDAPKTRKLMRKYDKAEKKKLQS